MKNIFLIALMLFSFSKFLVAQEIETNSVSKDRQFKFGVYANANYFMNTRTYGISDWENGLLAQPDRYEQNNKFGFDLGISAIYYSDQQFSIETGIGFISKGFTHLGMHYVKIGTIPLDFTGDGKLDATEYFVYIPLAFQFYINKKKQVGFKLKFSGDYGLTTVHKHTATKGTMKDGSTEKKESFEYNDTRGKFFLRLEAGVMVRILNKWGGNYVYAGFNRDMRKRTWDSSFKNYTTWPGNYYGFLLGIKKEI